MRSDVWEAEAAEKYWGLIEPCFALPALIIGRRLLPGLLVWLAFHLSPNVTYSERTFKGNPTYQSTLY